MLRRIVTGTSGEGKSVFSQDDSSFWTATFNAIPGFSVGMLWGTDGAIPGDAEPEVRRHPPTSWVPDAGGSRLLVVTFPPDSAMQSADFDGMAAHKEQCEKLPGLAERFEADHPGMHTTPTLDYGVVLTGEIILELDNGQARMLKPHDVVVQRGTRHAWRNHSSQPSTVLFVLLGTPSST